ncbi:MAG TPA: ABC transporter ATP-binding protein [Gemmataceae bacterium]|nr:ABC transporter ATP-binding protein [Gemmataceae bacterium]
MPSSHVAEFDKVVKDYPTGIFGRHYLRALQGVSFTLEAGEVFGLLGPNRAGKTTLVKLLLSLCQPTVGNVTRLGKPASDRSTLSRIGYVHENHAFPRYLTATSLLEFYGALSLLPEPEVRARAGQLLEMVGLADRAHEPIARFSKGMVQRLGVAQAMINDPELLVLDEPSEGLDLAGRAMVHSLVAEQRKRGHTVLLVSHVLGEVEQICDRAAVIVGGKLVFLGKMTELRRDKSKGGTRPLEQALREIYDKPSAKPRSGHAVAAS